MIGIEGAQEDSSTQKQYKRITPEDDENKRKAKIRCQGSRVRRQVGSGYCAPGMRKGQAGKTEGMGAEMRRDGYGGRGIGQINQNANMKG